MGLRRVMTSLADGKQGVHYQLANMTNLLINQLKLPVQVKQSSKYSALEVKLLYQDIFKRLVSGQDLEFLLQQMTLILICFATGLQGGSLVACSKQDMDS